jgi:multidrug efflux pump subunit AcrA (membrane-fusion protein)
VRLLAALALATALSQFHRAALGVVGPELAADLGGGPGLLGAANAAFFLAIALAQVPVGLALDRIGPRRTVAWLTVPAVDAFPFQRYGVLKGTVVTISGDAFTQPANDPSKPPVSYRVIVAIDTPEFTQAKTPAELLPGMTVTAEIVVGQRTVLSYFLYPLIRVVDEAIRER